MLIKQRKKKWKDLQTSNTFQHGTKILYTSCNDLPYEVFKKLCVDKDYSLLGSGNQEALETAWVVLYSEFCALSADENTKAYVQEWDQIATLSSRIFRLKLYLQFLQMGHMPSGTDSLQAYGIFINPEKLDKGAEKLQAKIQNDEAKLKMLKAGMLKKSTGNNSVNNYASFDESLSHIEKAFKVPIDPYKLSTQMYAIKLKDLKEYCRKLADK